MKIDKEIKAILKKQFEHDTIICPVCGEHQFENFGNYCPICGWEHDVVQSFDFNEDGFANELSLNQYKNIFENLRKENPQYRWENDPEKYERFRNPK